MKHKFQIFLLGAVVFLSIPVFVHGQVIINEIAWMGTSESANDEWMELYNTGGEEVSLEGWVLEAADGTPQINLSGTISASGFFLLERTDDETVPGIPADQIYTGALGNGGEDLILKDASGVVVNRVDASAGWPAGDNDTKETMQWNGSGWITALGTPRAANASDGSDDGQDGGDDQNDSGGGGDDSAHSGQESADDYTPSKPLRVSAGRDRLTSVGAPVELRAVAGNLEPETGMVRFVWSFGDGSQTEGEKVIHTYYLGGEYTVVLNAYQGGRQATAKAVIEAIEPEVEVMSTGDEPEPFIELWNKGGREVNLGGFQLLSGNERFLFPKDTLLAADAKVKFPTRINKLPIGAAIPVRLLYPHDRLLASYGPARSFVAVSVPPPNQAAVIDEVKLAEIKREAELIVEKLKNLSLAQASSPPPPIVPVLQTAAVGSLTASVAREDKVDVQEVEPIVIELESPPGFFRRLWSSFRGIFE